MAKKYERFITRKPVNQTDLPHHEMAGAVPFPVLVGSDLIPEANTWVAYMFVNPMPEALAKVIQNVGKALPHKHDNPEIYLIIGDQDAITAEVQMDEEIYEVSSPAAVYIPPGVPHSIKPLRATPGKAAGFIPIYLDGKYNTKDV